MASTVDDRIITIVGIVYSLGFLVNGFVSGGKYRQAFFPRTSPAWQRVMYLSSCLMPREPSPPASLVVAALIAYCAISAVNVTHHSIDTFPWAALLLFLLLFVLVCLPLQLVGTLLGRSFDGNPHNPCRTAAIPSPIPVAPWYYQPFWITVISGMLPFGAIFIEVFFLFASIWSYKYYFVYGFLLAILTILIIIQVCVSIVGSYLLLNAKNYNWRWSSFCSGMSIGIYLFVYSIYFYVCKTHMNGWIQGVSFFLEAVATASSTHA